MRGLIPNLTSMLEFLQCICDSEIYSLSRVSKNWVKNVKAALVRRISSSSYISDTLPSDVGNETGDTGMVQQTWLPWAMLP